MNKQIVLVFCIACLLIPLVACKIERNVDIDRATNSLDAVEELATESPQNYSLQNIESYFGKWIIVDVAFRDIDTVTSISRFKNGRDEDWVGNIISFNTNSFGLNQEVCSDVRYKTKETDVYYFPICTNISALDILSFTEKWYNQDSVDLVEVIIEENKEEINRIYLLPEGRMLISRGGTYFVCEKYDEEVWKVKPIPPPNPDPQILYGRWLIVDGFTSNEDKKDLSNYVGEYLKYTENSCTIYNIEYKDICYSYESHILLSEVLRNFYMHDVEAYNNFKFFLQKYALLEKEDVMIQNLILGDDKIVDVLGQFFYIFDENIIILYYDQVFLLAQKQ